VTLSGLLPLTISADPASVAPLLKPSVDRHELAGAIGLVADKKGVLSVSTVGFADIAAQKAMSKDAMFWIASQTKPMTTTAVMMLVDEGKIALDDPVEKYLPEFHGQMVVAEKDPSHVLLRKPIHPITVREVLNHMSGLVRARRCSCHEYGDLSQKGVGHCLDGSAWGIPRQRQQCPRRLQNLGAEAFQKMMGSN
jgi:CubicO group peptidase (beta-lactamase class C family)